MISFTITSSFGTFWVKAPNTSDMLQKVLSAKWITYTSVLHPTEPDIKFTHF